MGHGLNGSDYVWGIGPSVLRRLGYEHQIDPFGESLGTPHTAGNTTLVELLNERDTEYHPDHRRTSRHWSRHRFGCSLQEMGCAVGGIGKSSDAGVPGTGARAQYIYRRLLK